MIATVIDAAWVRATGYTLSPEQENVPLKHCRFRTSYGGALFCQHATYLEGFCRFHFQALQHGEMNENGVLNEKLTDQIRRREINYHGIQIPDVDYLEDLE